jgi:hypothetical protein
MPGNLAAKFFKAKPPYYAKKYVWPTKEVLDDNPEGG